MKRDKEFVRAAEKCREYRIKSNQCGKNKKLEIKSPFSIAIKIQNSNRYKMKKVSCIINISWQIFLIYHSFHSY